MANFYDSPFSQPNVAESAQSLAGLDAVSVDWAVTALGSSQATAYPVVKAFTAVSTAAASTGVILPDVPGVEYVIKNAGANTINVYPPVGGTIDSVGVVNSPQTLATNTFASFICATSMANGGNILKVR